MTFIMDMDTDLEPAEGTKVDTADMDAVEAAEAAAAAEEVTDFTE